MKLNTVLGTLLTLVIANDLCAQSTRPKAKAATRTTSQPGKGEEAFAGAKLDDKAFAHFGEGVHAGKSLTVAEVLAEPEAFDGKQIRVTGNINSVCQTKGCWMYVGEAKSEIMVRFKDYGFFMPLDSAGKQVVFEGVFKITEQSVAQQKHYLEDAKKPEEAAKVTTPKKVFGFMAQGVAIQNAAPAKAGSSDKGAVVPPASPAADGSTSGNGTSGNTSGKK